MRYFAIFLATIAWIYSVEASDRNIVYVDAQQLTHIGKMCATTNPYHRVEVVAYPEMNEKESFFLRTCAGEAIVFETNATEIWVRAKYGQTYYSRAMAPVAALGFNLFIERDKQWLWAASAVNREGRDANGYSKLEQPLQLIANMHNATKRCLLYLPLQSELFSLEIGVPAGAEIVAMDNPFSHRIAIFGSSYTQGSCAVGAGMTYPAFLQRAIGLDICSFGMSGNSKLQRFMGEVLGQTGAEAYVCDAFSNPTIEQIAERIRPFIEEIRKYNKKSPIIFLRGIYREDRNFDLASDAKASRRLAFVDSLMPTVCREYEDVYYIDVADQTGTDHETSADGIHPTSWGYKRWADAIIEPLLAILARYGIEH